MVKAEFVKTYVWSILCLCCGLFIVMMFVFCAINGVNKYEVAFGLAFGGLYTLGSVISLFFNFRAYLNMDNGYITGKYHLFGRIHCHLSDVEFVLAQPNALTIQLKNGKIHRILGVANSWFFCSSIRKHLIYDKTETPDQLIEELEACKSSRKKELIALCSGIGLMFVFILITVLLTGARDLKDFSRADWFIFSCFCVVEVITIILVFCLASRAGKNTLFVDKLKYDIRRRTIETTPLLPGNAIKVFADELYTTRIIVFGFPNTDSIYYTVERIGFDYSLREEGKSKIYEGIGPLPFDSQALTDVSEKFGC